MSPIRLSGHGFAEFFLNFIQEELLSRFFSVTKCFMCEAVLGDAGVVSYSARMIPA